MAITKSIKMTYINLEDLNINADNPNPETVSVGKIHTAVKAEGFSLTKGFLTVELVDGVYTVLCGNNRLTWAKKLYAIDAKVYKSVIGTDGTYPCEVKENLTIEERNGLIFDVSANKRIMPFYCMDEINRNALASSDIIQVATSARQGFESLLQSKSSAEFADLLDRYCVGDIDEQLRKKLQDKCHSHVQVAKYYFCGSARLRASLWDASYPSKDQQTSQYMIKITKANLALLAKAYMKDGENEGIEGGVEGELFNALWHKLDAPKAKVFTPTMLKVKDLETALIAIQDPRLKLILQTCIISETGLTSANQAGELIKLCQDFDTPLSVEIAEVDEDALSLNDIEM